VGRHFPVGPLPRFDNPRRHNAIDPKLNPAPDGRAVLPFSRTSDVPRCPLPRFSQARPQWAAGSRRDRRSRPTSVRTVPPQHVSSPRAWGTRFFLFHAPDRSGDRRRPGPDQRPGGSFLHAQARLPDGQRELAGGRPGETIQSGFFLQQLLSTNINFLHVVLRTRLRFKTIFSAAGRREAMPQTDKLRGRGRPVDKRLDQGDREDKTYFGGVKHRPKPKQAGQAGRTLFSFGGGTARGDGRMLTCPRSPATT